LYLFVSLSEAFSYGLNSIYELEAFRRRGSDPTSSSNH